MRQFTILAAAVTALTFSSSVCFAQAQGLFNTGGSTQNQGAGGGRSGGGIGQGAQGLGQGGGGLTQGAGAAGQGAAADFQLSEFGTASSMVGQTDFVGRANATGQFIGTNQGATQGQQQAATPRFTQAGGQGGQGFQPDNNQQGTERRIRPRYRVAFDYDSLSATTVEQRSRQHVRTFQTAFNLPDSISVELDEAGTVTLRGQAESAEMSRLIANVVRLEPGVRDVRNELVVAEESTP